MTMTRSEREAFLAEPHVAMLAVSGDGRGPIASPIWYLYEPGGDVLMVTHTKSKKGRQLAAEGRATLLVQSEALPYRHVTVEGAVAFEPFGDGALVRRLGVRYLGPGLGEQYGDALMRMVDAIVRLRPERWSATVSPLGAV
jgi:PPOX class probable F420-dependent enzyme